MALARGLAAAGADIVLNGRDPAKLSQAAASLRDGGYSVNELAFDVTDHAATRAAIDGFDTGTGAIDILINNAGIQRRAPLEEFDPKDFDDLLDVNIKGVFNAGQACAQHMIGRCAGKVVNICSALARPSIAPYTATKGAVANLTKGMATDRAKHGLQINGLAPGYFETPLNQALVDDPEFAGWLTKRTPAGRWGRTEELVGCAIFLSSEASSFVNGTTIFVDGGITAGV